MSGIARRTRRPIACRTSGSRVSEPPDESGQAARAGVSDSRAARSALVLTASDKGAAGERDDSSGGGDRSTARTRSGSPSNVPSSRTTSRRSNRRCERPPRATRSIVTTGGTGLTPRDVTPQATLAVVDYEVPGLAEAMRAEGRRHTPMADLSRAVVGVSGGSLIVNLPGSPKGAIESLEAIVPVLDHALETLAGPFDHGAADEGAAADSHPVASPDEHE